jgi:hypothetical protein
MGNNKRRIVVPTAPQPRRANNYRHSRKPERMSGALFDSAIVVITTLTTTFLLLLISGQIHDTTAGNLIARSAAPVAITGQPTPEPTLPGHPSPGPGPSAQPTRSVASPTTTPAITENEPVTNDTDDATIQAAIDKRLQNNGASSSSDITATVTDGKVTLVGTVPSDEVKEKIEKLVRGVKGVKQIDNQIVVVSES